MADILQTFDEYPPGYKVFTMITNVDLWTVLYKYAYLISNNGLLLRRLYVSAKPTASTQWYAVVREDT